MNQLDLFRDGAKVHEYEVGIWYRNPNLDTTVTDMPSGLHPYDTVSVKLGSSDSEEEVTRPAERWHWQTFTRSDGVYSYGTIRMFRIVSRALNEPA